MSDSPDTPPLSSHKLNPELVSLYEEATRQDDDMVEFLCPAFASLKATETRYTDAKKIGEGALKLVYRAFDNRARRWVAMAKLKKERGFRYYDHFIHEAWLIAGLKHPNIIKVHNVGADEDGRPFFTMDLKGDVSFEDIIHREPAVPLSDLLEIFCKVCDAIAYAHAQKVIHLDLKPENIQCDTFGEVLVCDWGLGQRLEGYVTYRKDNEEEEPLPRLDYGDEDERILGSLGYMAPEQVEQGSQKDERTDIYALGCILHTILCGEPPFKGDTDEILKATSQSHVPPFAQNYPNRSIPDGLQSVTLKALSLEPEDRYESAHTLKLEIQNYLAGYATQAENPSFFREASLFLHRNKVPAIISTLAFAVIITISVLFIQYLGQEQLATQEERNRANSLLSEVSVLSIENEELFKQSNVTKQQLAIKLSEAANRARNFGIFDNPTEAVKRAELLVDMAFALNPQSRHARLQRIELNAIKLNFKAVLSDPIAKNYKPDTALQILANAFPQYNFSEKSRPSSEEMVAVFNKATEENVRGSGLLERIFAYNYDSIGNRVKQEPIIIAFLEWVNNAPGALEYDYSWSNRSLKIRSPKNLRLRIRASGSSKRSILRVLSIRELTLACGGTFDLADLNTMGVETLDVSECEQLIFKNRISLPYLKKIYIRPDQISEELLLQTIRRSSGIEIIEVTKDDIGLKV